MRKSYDAANQIMFRNMHRIHKKVEVIGYEDKITLRSKSEKKGQSRPI